MSLEGGNIIRERVAKYAIDCDLEPGNAFVAFHDKQMRYLEHAAADWKRHGHDGLELVDRAGAEAASSTPTAMSVDCSIITAATCIR